MKNLRYLGIDATGMSRNEFERTCSSLEIEANEMSLDYLNGYVNGCNDSRNFLGRVVNKIIPFAEPLKLRVYREVLKKRSINLH